MKNNFSKPHGRHPGPSQLIRDPWLFLPIIKILNVFIFISILFIASPIYAKSHIVKTDNVPGGIVIKSIPRSSKAYFNKHRVMILKKRWRYWAIVGIPLTMKPGKHYLLAVYRNKRKLIPIKIRHKQYPFTRLTVRNSGFIPTKDFIKRLSRENTTTHKAFEHWSNKNNVDLNFIMPVQGRISSQFGVHRLMNYSRSSQHRGIDIAAKTGTPIRAPAYGTVIKTGRYVLLGNTIFIDHGQNLITVYAHLSKILVKANQHVKRGQIIGRVGSTGRSTGPHLHWGVNLNNTRVNPLLFI